MVIASELEKERAIPAARVASLLGEPALQCIIKLARQADEQEAALYLVGGVIRDLFMNRRNQDLDFVVEGDAIAFVSSLARRYGGRIEKHAPFGTAKWLLDDETIAKLSLDGDTPRQIDFASARTETYSAPAALPTVAPGSIYQDSQRRDFSINAMALRPTVDSRDWTLLDGHGGFDDIHSKRIRVLHDRSFVDDPTRIFRACRFAGLFAFTIEPHTAGLMRDALPYIQELSGERIRHELDMTLRENHPETIIMDLQARHAIKRIHSAFVITPQLKKLFRDSREQPPPWAGDTIAPRLLYWHLLMTDIPEEAACSICQRLGLPGGLRKSILAFCRLASNQDILRSASARNSQIACMLDNIPDAAIQAIWIVCNDDAMTKERIERFMLDWRYRLPTVDGHDLRRMGLTPGPIFREILTKLRRAWIDGDVKTVDEECALLDKLLADAE